MNKNKERMNNSIFQNMKKIFTFLMILMFIISLFAQNTKAVNKKSKFYSGEIEERENKMIDTDGEQNKKFNQYHKNEYKKNQKKWRRWKKKGKNNKNKKEGEKPKTYSVEFEFVDAATQMNKEAADRYHDIDRSKGDETPISCTYRVLLKSDKKYQPYSKEVKIGKVYKDKLPAGEYKLEMEKKGYMPTFYFFKVPAVTDGYIGIQRIHTGLELKILNGNNPNQKIPLQGVKISIWNADKTSVLQDDYTFSGTGEEFSNKTLVKKTNEKGIVRFPLVKGNYWIQINDDKIKEIKYSPDGEKFQEIKVTKGKGKVYKGYKHKSPKPRTLNGNKKIKERVDKKGKLKLNVKFTKAVIYVDAY